MKPKTVTALIVLILLSISFNACAEGTMHSKDLLDNILYRFSSTASLWSKTLQGYAQYLFWSLATISMVWTYGLMALRKADIQEFLAETVQFFVVLGFFYWILENGPAIATAIIDTLRKLAANAAGIDARISPSNIMDVGFDIVYKAIDNSSVWSPAATTVGLMVAGIILVILTLVSINMLVILITAWILTYGGIILLGFGGGRWTQDIAIQYYKTVLGIALQAFAMILIIGIGKSFVDQYYAAMSQDILLKEMFVMLVVAIILLALINKIPPVLASIVSGGGSGGGGGIGFGSAAAATGMAASALASGAAVMGTQAAGGVAALQAAFQAASQSVGSSESGSGSLAQAAKFAGSFGSHLATGAMDAVSEKLGNMKEAFSEKIADTAGGQVADAIQERASSGGNSSTPGESSNVSSMGTPEGSFSAGNSQDSAANEVSEFVEKKASGENS